MLSFYQLRADITEEEEDQSLKLAIGQPWV